MKQKFHKSSCSHKRGKRAEDRTLSETGRYELSAGGWREGGGEREREGEGRERERGREERKEEVVTSKQVTLDVLSGAQETDNAAPFSITLLLMCKIVIKQPSKPSQRHCGQPT